ncbi:MAG TPA: type II CAAX endopeptidase family protein [Thermoanaerobaculia bacterium]
MEIENSRPLGHPLPRAVLYLVAYVAVEIAVIFVFSLLDWLLGGFLSQEGGLSGSNEAFLLATVMTAPPMLAATWLFVRYLDRRDLASIGIRWPDGGRRRAWRQLVTTPLVVFALLGLWLALMAVLAEVRFGGLSDRFREPAAGWPAPQVLFLAVLLLGFLIQGGLEELIVRGYIYRALKERWRPWLAALASSVLFSALHAINPNVSWAALVNIALAGLVLAAMVERSGSLWSATIAHGLWNWAVACVLSLPVSGIRIFRLFEVSIQGDERLTGGGFGPEGSLALTLLASLLALALWWPRRPEDARPSPPSAPEDGPGPPLL